MNVTLKRTADTSTVRLSIGSVLAVVAAFASAGFILWITGKPVGDAFISMYTASFGTLDGWEATLTRAAPLALTGLAVSTALRMQTWNIGAEGQLLIGAATATAVGFAVPGLPTVFLLPLMCLGAIIGGMVWVLLAAIPRAALGVNEIIVTLFLNYIAIRVVSLLVYGPWKDPGAVGFAYSRPVPAQGLIGTIPGTNVSLAVPSVVVLAIVISLVLDRSRWGFSVDIAGGNSRLANYLGFSHRAKIVSIMVLSGALAGLAGVVQLSASSGRLQPDLASGYGYAGILVAFLAGRRIFKVLGVAVLFAGLIQGGIALQSNGIPSALSSVIQAFVIFFILIARTLSHYRLQRSHPLPENGASHDPPQHSPSSLTSHTEAHVQS